MLEGERKELEQIILHPVSGCFLPSLKPEGLFIDSAWVEIEGWLEDQAAPGVYKLNRGYSTLRFKFVSGLKPFDAKVYISGQQSLS